MDKIIRNPSEQVDDLNTEIDQLKAQVAAFLAAFKVGHSGGAPSIPERMWITARGEEEILSSHPAQKPKFDALYDLWKIINQK